MLESTIYRTRGEHANHYATDAFDINTKLLSWSNIIKKVIKLFQYEGRRVDG